MSLKTQKTTDKVVSDIEKISEEMLCDFVLGERETESVDSEIVNKMVHELFLLRSQPTAAKARDAALAEVIDILRERKLLAHKRKLLSQTEAGQCTYRGAQMELVEVEKLLEQRRRESEGGGR
jgi:hypothetical protein